MSFPSFFFLWASRVSLCARFFPAYFFFFLFRLTVKVGNGRVSKNCCITAGAATSRSASFLCLFFFINNFHTSGQRYCKSLVHDLYSVHGGKIYPDLHAQSKLFIFRAESASRGSFCCARMHMRPRVFLYDAAVVHAHRENFFQE